MILDGFLAKQYKKRIVKHPFLDKHSEMNCYLCKF